MSKELTSAIVVVVISVLQLFKVEIAETVVASVVTAVAGIVLYIIRYKKGDVTALGFKK